ncbi:unnamed protein product [Haemonchus placei]|uniref:Phlebovirus_G2 domain-containing protein n=1 Tax=Haemonchus placei TaxID=6290 RepID=A0A0N4X3V3_HAEPC|nr:unnamed protein product [Haemonchus placei]
MSEIVGLSMNIKGRHRACQYPNCIRRYGVIIAKKRAGMVEVTKKNVKADMVIRGKAYFPKADYRPLEVKLPQILGHRFERRKKEVLPESGLQTVRSETASNFGAPFREKKEGAGYHYCGPVKIARLPPFTIYGCNGIVNTKGKAKDSKWSDEWAKKALEWLKSPESVKADLVIKGKDVHVGDKVDAEVSLQQEDKITTSTVVLPPGRTTQSCLLQSHSVGQLQCSTRHAAEQVNSVFSRNICTCTTALHSTCSNGNVRDRMDSQPFHRLRKTSQFSDPTTTSTQEQTPDLQYNSTYSPAENLRITTLKHISCCHVETTPLSGCYSCFTGASTTMSCTSDNHEVLAQVKCGQHSHAIRCTEYGFLNTVFFMFDTPTIAADCIAACPRGTMNFTIEGSLVFVNEKAFSSDTNATQVEWQVQNDLLYVNDIFDNFKNNLIAFVYGIASFFDLWSYFFLLIIALVLLNLLFRIGSKKSYDKVH